MIAPLVMQTTSHILSGRFCHVGSYHSEHSEVTKSQWLFHNDKPPIFIFMVDTQTNGQFEDGESYIPTSVLIFL